MSLLPGTRLGRYKITGRLGAGGMGEVYRATDASLGREVAIKILPPVFAQDAERLARFEREARTLASLSHPNIAVVFGFEPLDAGQEDSEAGRALVMELVDGPTLAELIAHGPIPIDEAVEIAKQIAEALEAAHGHGIIHRDLKPANVKVRADGTVKVLDFGLAKGLEPAGAVSPAHSLSPTITTPAMTQAGILLGTAAYMSPEQARGKPVDKRADVWAFGCVLYEMLSGRRAVPDEETVSDTLAGVLKGEPLWKALPAETPARIRTLIERCLRKDLRRRLPDIAEARIQLEEAATDSAAVPEPAAKGRRGRFLWPAIAVLALLIAAGLAAWVALVPADGSRVVRLDIEAPLGATPLAVDGRLIDNWLDISPDGRRVAFLAAVDRRTMVWVRDLDGDSRPLAGTQGAQRFAWSPDSRQIAFFANGVLKRVSLRGGGPPTDVCRMDVIAAATARPTDGVPPRSNEAQQVRDIAWAPGNEILTGGAGTLARVSPDTCEPRSVTQLASNETSHDYPHFLPDRRHFLYMARHGSEPIDWDVYVGSLDSTERHVVAGIHSSARYSPTGHLLFMRAGSLMAQPFDADRLQITADAFQVAEGPFGGPSPAFSVSQTGSLAFIRAPSEFTRQLSWFNRDGKPLAALGAPGDYRRIDLSPDDGSVAFDRPAPESALDVFVYDIRRNSMNKVVSSAAADFAAVWSPAGDAIAFASSREPAGNAGPANTAAGNLYQRAVDIIDVDIPVWKSNQGKTPSDWSRDGYLAYTSAGDIFALKLPVSSDLQPIQVADTKYRERDGRFSPDSRLIAYESNESDVASDVYVQTFPERRARQVVNAGSTPRWARTGNELFFIGPDRMMMSVVVTMVDGTIQVSTPRSLFALPPFEGIFDYDVARDGRFLVAVPAVQQKAPPLTVIHNWGTTLTAR